MPDGFPLGTAWRIAWRESRSSPAKFLFVVLAVAVGVGALTGVRSFSREFRRSLAGQARTLMGADLSVRTYQPVQESQVAALDALAKSGVRSTRISETVSMVSTSSTATPVLVSIKAVDPSLYPFYGVVRLEPAGRLTETLTDGTIVVSEDLILRLGVGVGGVVRLGEAEFRVAGVVVEEPDRMTGSFNVGPRLMMTRGGLERTGLITVGSRTSERFLLRLPPGGASVAEVRAAVSRAFPRARIADFRESHPLITRGLDHATVFLSLVSLMAVIVGAVGVATAMRSHLDQKMDSIATIKSIGGRSGQVLRIYLLQTAMLGVAGSALGILGGLLVQRAFPLLLARYFPIQPAWRMDPLPAVQGVLVGVVVTLLFTLPPLLRIRTIRPAVILRRDMPEAQLPWRARLRASGAAFGASVLLLAGTGLVAAWLSESWRTAGFFVGGAAACLAVMSGAAWGLLAALRWLVARAGRRMPSLVRYGIANLYRPGSHSGAVLVALGTGVMFTLTVYLVQGSLIERFLATAPPDMPNVFLINITEDERAGLADFILRQPGVRHPPVMIAAAEARLTAINGVALARPPRREAGERGGERRGNGPDRGPGMGGSRTVSWSREIPPNTRVVEGYWWTNSDPLAPQVSVAEETARRLDVEPGDVLEFSLAGRALTARIACLHRTEAIRPGASIEYVFSPGVLDKLPLTYYGGVRVEPAAVGSLQREIYARNPTVTVVNVADVLAIVQEVVDQVALVIRFVSAFAILAGAVILASSIAGTRFRRIREVAVLKTLGATRARVAAVFSLEFLILGSVAGLMGSLLASAFTAVALGRLFEELHYTWDAWPSLAAIGLTATVAVAAGWLASARILGRKPLEVLRSE